jgi:hypothetical protein
LFVSFCRDERKAYIKAKYEEKKFVQPYCSNAQEIYCELEQSIASHNLYDLLQTYAEAGIHGVDLTDPLPASVSIVYCLTSQTKVVILLKIVLSLI